MQWPDLGISREADAPAPARPWGLAGSRGQGLPARGAARSSGLAGGDARRCPASERRAPAPSGRTHHRDARGGALRRWPGRGAGTRALWPGLARRRPGGARAGSSAGASARARARARAHPQMDDCLGACGAQGREGRAPAAAAPAPLTSLPLLLRRLPRCRCSCAASSPPWCVWVRPPHKTTQNKLCWAGLTDLGRVRRSLSPVCTNTCAFPIGPAIAGFSDFSSRAESSFGRITIVIQVSAIGGRRSF